MNDITAGFMLAISGYVVGVLAGLAHTRILDRVLRSKVARKAWKLYIMDYTLERTRKAVAELVASVPTLAQERGMATDQIDVEPRCPVCGDPECMRPKES